MTSRSHRLATQLLLQPMDPERTLYSMHRTDFAVPSRMQVGSGLGFSPLPLLLQAQPGQTLQDIDEATRQSLCQALLREGGVLLRGFRVGSPLEFRKFAASF